MEQKSIGFSNSLKLNLLFRQKENPSLSKTTFSKSFPFTLHLVSV